MKSPVVPLESGLVPFRRCFLLFFSLVLVRTLFLLLLRAVCRTREGRRRRRMSEAERWKVWEGGSSLCGMQEEVWEATNSRSPFPNICGGGR
jgi:hypothetical protein